MKYNLNDLNHRRFPTNLPLTEPTVPPRFIFSLAETGYSCELMSQLIHNESVSIPL